MNLSVTCTNVGTFAAVPFPSTEVQEYRGAKKGRNQSNTCATKETLPKNSLNSRPRQIQSFFSSPATQSAIQAPRRLDIPAREH